MDLRFYNPVSKFLKPIDGEPKDANYNDLFTFSISCKQCKTGEFSVYKSLASFLSSNANQQFKLNSSFLSITYQSHQLPPDEVKNQLISLLSGKPINISQANFQVFE
jgi:hypothetical protein